MTQDLGNLQDYLLNGDNYERVQPDGSVLIIPGSYGQQPLIVTSEKDYYRPLASSADCAAAGTDPCAIIFHEYWSGLYYIWQICGSTAPDDCCTVCRDGAQAFADSKQGTPASQFWPGWLYALLPPAAQVVIDLDFYFCGCYSGEIYIPDLFPPASAACPSGDVLNTGVCPAGFFIDPTAPACCKPLDPPVPFGIRNLVGPSRPSFQVPGELYGRRLFISSTRFEPAELRSAQPPPLPPVAVMPLPAGKCGCETSEEIDVL